MKQPKTDIFSQTYSVFQHFSRLQNGSRGFQNENKLNVRFVMIVFQLGNVVIGFGLKMHGQKNRGGRGKNGP
jgi:hypothetical protein